MTPPPDYAEVVARAGASAQSLHDMSSRAGTPTAKLLKHEQSIHDLLAIVRQQRELVDVAAELVNADIEPYPSAIEGGLGCIDLEDWFVRLKNALHTLALSQRSVCVGCKRTTMSDPDMMCEICKSPARKDSADEA